MKEKISPDKDFELKTPDKTSDIIGSHSAEEINKLNSYWPACVDPFMPMIDLTIVFDELIKMVKCWFLKKGKPTNNYKNNSRENI
ncbi:hypothetical protein [Chitinophaga sp. CF418]|uniref:hypothetical protein n=1 Tax=Chitinophaga sp. CF418 TaxID=1855287 RepID=UPI0009104050|nr:hypothetical protein [Chitinophaga sp. CF418]SHN24709.1 hypothetical protein SAMN05216311_107273 [Chitinophaga sp. CF418]